MAKKVILFIMLMHSMLMTAQVLYQSNDSVVGSLSKQDIGMFMLQSDLYQDYFDIVVDKNIIMASEGMSVMKDCCPAWYEMIENSIDDFYFKRSTNHNSAVLELYYNGKLVAAIPHDKDVSGYLRGLSAKFYNIDGILSVDDSLYRNFRDEYLTVISSFENDSSRAKIYIDNTIMPDVFPLEYTNTYGLKIIGKYEVLEKYDFYGDYRFYRIIDDFCRSFCKKHSLSRIVFNSFFFIYTTPEQEM